MNDCNDGVRQLSDERVSAQTEAKAREKSPWKRATDRVLFGVLLSAVSLFGWTRVFALPALLLAFLGFRSLKSENEYFCRGGKLTFARLCLSVAGTVIDSTVFRSYPFFLWGKETVYFLDGLLLLFTLFFIWMGIAAVRKELRLSTHLKDVTVLLVTAGMFLGLTYFLGRYPIIFFLFFLIGFVVLKAYRRSQEVDQHGYTMVEVAPKFSDRRVVGMVFLMTACGVLFGLLFFQKYRMRWEKAETVSDAELIQIRTELLKLGFPEEVLSDLREEDIRACEGAERVVVFARKHPMNRGREIVEKVRGGVIRRVVYDRQELKITGVSVEIPSVRPTWRIFHHFLWEEDPGFVGTEAIEIRENLSYRDWSIFGSIDGRVLYENAGKTFVSEDMFMEKENAYLIQSERPHQYATFSFPSEGERQRGYVTYMIHETTTMGSNVECPIQYVHQRSRWQFPVTTAEECARFGRSIYDVFERAMDGILFYPKIISERESTVNDRDRTHPLDSGEDVLYYLLYTADDEQLENDTEKMKKDLQWSEEQIKAIEEIVLEEHLNLSLLDRLKNDAGSEKRLNDEVFRITDERNQKIAQVLKTSDAVKAFREWIAEWWKEESVRRMNMQPGADTER